MAIENKKIRMASKEAEGSQTKLVCGPKEPTTDAFQRQAEKVQERRRKLLDALAAK